MSGPSSEEIAPKEPKEIEEALRIALAPCLAGRHHVPLEVMERDAAWNGTKHRCVLCRSTKAWGLGWMSHPILEYLWRRDGE